MSVITLMTRLPMLGLFVYSSLLLVDGVESLSLDLLYSNAVACPARAKEKCELEVEEEEGTPYKTPCCDYSFDSTGLVREENFIEVSTQGDPKNIAANIHSWLIRADRNGEFYDERNPKYLIYSHGNVDNLTFSKRLYVYIAKTLGINVIAWDYPGFGRSVGEPSESLIHESAAEVFKWLVNKEKAAHENIILWGYSLGGKVTTNLGIRFPRVAGVILQAPIDSSLEVVRSALEFMAVPLYQAALLMGSIEPYDTIAEIGKLQTCLFLFVGEKDDTMEPERMKNLYDLAKKKKASCSFYSEIPSMGHFTNPLDRKRAVQELENFLRDAYTRRSI